MGLVSLLLNSVIMNMCLSSQGHAVSVYCWALRNGPDLNPHLNHSNLTPDLWPCVFCNIIVVVSNEHGRKWTAAAVAGCFNWVFGLPFFFCLFDFLTQTLAPSFYKIKWALQLAFAFWKAAPSPPCSIIYAELLTPYSCGSRNTHTYTDSCMQLCKYMSHVLAGIFLGLCFGRESWQFFCRRRDTQSKDYYWRWRERDFCFPPYACFLTVVT